MQHTTRAVEHRVMQEREGKASAEALVEDCGWTESSPTPAQVPNDDHLKKSSIGFQVCAWYLPEANSRIPRCSLLTR